MDSLCLSWTVYVCHRHFVSVIKNLCLSVKNLDKIYLILIIICPWDLSLSASAASVFLDPGGGGGGCGGPPLVVVLAVLVVENICGDSIKTCQLSRKRNNSGRRWWFQDACPIFLRHCTWISQCLPLCFVNKYIFTNTSLFPNACFQKTEPPPWPPSPWSCCRASPVLTWS